ncbi:TPA: hypothetical protein ACGO5I_001447 [Streptococcus suis]
MKKLNFNLLLIAYSVFMAFTISDTLNVLFMANAVIFYVSAYIAFLVTKFITEVIETQLYCDTYFEISDSLYHVFISSLLARALLITLNLYSYLNGQNVVLFYSMFNLLLVFIVLRTKIKKGGVVKVNWLKNFLMIAPTIIYVVLDIYSFKGGLK